MSFANLMSLRMWPISPSLSPEFKVWMIDRAFDLKMARGMLISAANSTPWCRARASVTFVVKVEGRSLLKAPMAVP